MDIYCCECQNDVQARLTNGAEIYPHRSDLAELPFWKCDTCGNYVGTHHKTTNHTAPLGVIPTPEIRKARYHIHKLLDKLWGNGRMSRTTAYKLISERCGWNYHTAKIRSIEEAREIYRIVQSLFDTDEYRMGIEPAGPDEGDGWHWITGND